MIQGMTIQDALNLHEIEHEAVIIEDGKPIDTKKECIDCGRLFDKNSTPYMHYCPIEEAPICDKCCRKNCCYWEDGCTYDEF